MTGSLPSLPEWLWRDADTLEDCRIQDVNDLLPQVTDHSFEKVTRERLKETMNGGWAYVEMIWEDGRVRAMAELHAFTTVTERKGQIDNVVVDANFRGRRLGETLMRLLLDRAFVLHPRPLDLVQLTSNPDNPKRMQARALYSKLGFKERYLGFFVIKKDEWLEVRHNFGSR